MVTFPKMKSALLATSAAGVALSLLGRQCVEAKSHSKLEAINKLAQSKLHVQQKAIDAAHASVMAAMMAESANTNRKLQLLVGKEEAHMCTICHGGSQPANPDRMLQLVSAPEEGMPYVPDEGMPYVPDEGNATEQQKEQQQQPPLTCSRYSSTFLTLLFPDDPVCEAFQGAAAGICGCPRLPRPCTLCAGGVAPRNPDGVFLLPLPSPHDDGGTLSSTTDIGSVPTTCSDWSAVTETTHAEGEAGCDAARTTGVESCGCPPPCKICRDGSDLPDPDRVLDLSSLDFDLPPSVDGLQDSWSFGPDGQVQQLITCGDAEDAATVVAGLFGDQDGGDGLDEPTTSGAVESFDVPDVCAAYQQVFRPACGCPETSTSGSIGSPSCEFCEGGLLEPDKEIDFEIDGVTIRMTCQSAQALASDVVSLSWSESTCTHFKVQAANIGCACKDSVDVASSNNNLLANSDGTKRTMKAGAVASVLSVAFSLFV